MEIKTTREIIDWRFENCSPEESTNRIYFVKWVKVDDMIKELEKYHNGLHTKCNICKLINALTKNSASKEAKTNID